MESKLAIDLDWLKKQQPILLAGAGTVLLMLLAIWALGGFASQATYRDAIRAVIVQDKALSQEMQSRASVWELVVGSNPDRFDSMVGGMKQIDLRRCPRAFRSAYQNHIHAWFEYAGAQRAGGNTTIAQQHIVSTWLEVRSVAQQYGIDDASR